MTGRLMERWNFVRYNFLENNMEKYTFPELIKKTVEELENIKAEKQQELYEAKKEKAVLCANIISLQGMIKAEKKF